MRRNLLFATLVLITILITSFVYLGSRRISQKKQKEAIWNSREDMLNSIGSSATAHQGYSMLVYFSSECHICHEELEELSENIKDFKNVKIFFFTFDPRADAEDFLLKNHLIEDSTSFLFTNDAEVMNTMSGGVPQLFLYYDDKLISHEKGISAVARIKNLLSEKTHK